MTRPTFEHRHYVKLADILADLPDGLTRSQVAFHFAERLTNTNPNFNMARFMDAARGEPSNGRDKVR